MRSRKLVVVVVGAAAARREPRRVEGRGQIELILHWIAADVMRVMRVMRVP
jgi:hypothetical protein